MEILYLLIALFGMAILTTRAMNDTSHAFVIFIANLVVCAGLIFLNYLTFEKSLSIEAFEQLRIGDFISTIVIIMPVLSPFILLFWTFVLLAATRLKRSVSSNN
jgi:hypothetical protein